MNLFRSNTRTPLVSDLFIAVLFALVGLCFLQIAKAQDGGYPNNNTAEGDFALSTIIGNPDAGTGAYNTAIGFEALFSDTTGVGNTATGIQALTVNTTGSFNTANGNQALYRNTTGNFNTALGDSALNYNQTGGSNTATGYQALASNQAGNFNTATGTGALYFNESDQNTAHGAFALYSNTTGFANTALGENALYTNTIANNNTAAGHDALTSNTTGSANTAVGDSSLNFNTDGYFNMATGASALFFNTGGYYNTASGVLALERNTTGYYNTATGNEALINNTTGYNNIAVGAFAGSALTTGNNNIDIGNQGGVGESNTIRIGIQGAQTNTFIAGVSGTTVAKSLAVFVDASGHLGVKASSQRFKDDIKPMNKSSEAILALKPVTFRYKKQIDPEGTPQFGLVAEDVAKVNADLVVRDTDGKPYTVRYDAVNAMLLNEFLKEHRKNEEQEATITALSANDSKQEATIAQQQKQIDALSTALQKVSAQLEVSKPAPQTVANNQ